MGMGMLNPGCLCCCPVTWTFTDHGFIDGGQDGALREYDDPSDVSASPWTILDQCLGLRCDFEDSNDAAPRNVGYTDSSTTGEDNINYPEPGGEGCAEHNPYRQTATASGAITLSSAKIMTINWIGEGEQEDGVFELMEITIDGTTAHTAHSPGGGQGCAEMAPIVSSTNPPVEVALAAGAHTLEIVADTADNWYHVGAFYQFQLSFRDPP